MVDTFESRSEIPDPGFWDIRIFGISGYLGYPDIQNLRYSGSGDIQDLGYPRSEDIQDLGYLRSEDGSSDPGPDLESGILKKLELV